MMKPVLSCEDDPPVDDSDRSMLLEVFFTGRVGSPASSSGPIAAATAGAAEHAPPLAPAPPPSPPTLPEPAAVAPGLTGYRALEDLLTSPSPAQQQRMRATARVERNAPGSSSAPMPRRKLAHTPKIPKRRPWRTAAQPSEATHLDTLSQANVMLSVGNNGSSQKALQQIELVFDAIESRAGNLVTASTPQAQRPRSSGGPGESGGAGGGADASSCDHPRVEPPEGAVEGAVAGSEQEKGAKVLSASLPLVSLLNSDSRVIQEQAAWALANLTSNPDNKMKILQLGALDRLRALHLSPSDEVQAASTKVLASLGEILTPSSRRAISSRKSHGTTPAAVGSSARRSSPLVAQGPDEEGMGASSRLASDLGSFKS